MRNPRSSSLSREAFCGGILAAGIVLAWTAPLGAQEPQTSAPEKGPEALIRNPPLAPQGRVILAAQNTVARKAPQARPVQPIRLVPADDFMLGPSAAQEPAPHPQSASPSSAWSSNPVAGVAWPRVVGGRLNPAVPFQGVVDQPTQANAVTSPTGSVDIGKWARLRSMNTRRPAGAGQHVTGPGAPAALDAPQESERLTDRDESQRRQTGRAIQLFPASGAWPGSFGYGETMPRLSLPIGLPSIEIVHTPGFTYTSNARIEYRVLGAPAPNLGAGNLVPVLGNRLP